MAQRYAVQGSDEPHTSQGLGVNRGQRIAANLDVVSGKLFSCQRRRFDRQTLIHYYQPLEATYPEAELIFVAKITDRFTFTKMF